MIVSDAVNAQLSIDAQRDRFIELCENRAMLCAEGLLDLPEAAEELQAIAHLTGFVALVGQDAVQAFMNSAFEAVAAAVDLHEAYEIEIMLRAAATVRGWEEADFRDRWRHTGEPKPRPERREWPVRKPYSTPESTISAFHVVMQSGDAERISAWIRHHPDDAPALLKILETA